MSFAIIVLDKIPVPFLYFSYLHPFCCRQWVLGFFCFTSAVPAGTTVSTDSEDLQGLLDDEIAYIESLLKKDIRNNSAWNQVMSAEVVGALNENEIHYSIDGSFSMSF